MWRWALSLLALAACTRDPAPAPPAPAPAPPPAPVAASAPSPDAVAAPDTVAVVDDHHRLHAAEGALAIVPPANVTTGSAATATLTLTAAAGFRVNSEFPVRLSLVPPDGIAIAKPDLARADALVSDDQHLVLAVELVAHEPGSYAVTGSFKFALCQRDACFTKDEPVALDFTASTASTATAGPPSAP